MPINIALDGPVGAGKSSIADKVAARLRILHLDTGAMYRAVGLYMLRAGVALEDSQTISARCGEAAVTVSYENAAQRTLLCGEDVTDKLYAQEVSAAASAVAKVPAVRARMVESQQEIARVCDVLVDGRDIGTRVLPDAPVKIFLTAEDTVRAKRRQIQLEGKGTRLPFEEVLESLRARDWQDMHRQTDPLRQAEDAILVDSTKLTEEETVDAIVKIVEGVYEG